MDVRIHATHLALLVVAALALAACGKGGETPGGVEHFSEGCFDYVAPAGTKSQRSGPPVPNLCAVAKD